MTSPAMSTKTVHDEPISEASRRDPQEVPAMTAESVLAEAIRIAEAKKYDNEVVGTIMDKWYDGKLQPKDPCKWQGYLFTMLKNAARDLARKGEKLQTGRDSTPDGTTETVDPADAEIADVLVRTSAVFLDEEKQQLLDMRVKDDLKFREIVDKQSDKPHSSSDTPRELNDEERLAQLNAEKVAQRRFKRLQDELRRTVDLAELDTMGILSLLGLGKRHLTDERCYLAHEEFKRIVPVALRRLESGHTHIRGCDDSRILVRGVLAACEHMLYCGLYRQARLALLRTDDAAAVLEDKCRSQRDIKGTDPDIALIITRRQLLASLQAAVSESQPALETVEPAIAIGSVLKSRLDSDGYESLSFAYGTKAIAAQQVQQESGLIATEPYDWLSAAFSNFGTQNTVLGGVELRIRLAQLCGRHRFYEAALRLVHEILPQVQHWPRYLAFALNIEAKAHLGMGNVEQAIAPCMEALLVRLLLNEDKRRDSTWSSLREICRCTNDCVRASIRQFLQRPDLPKVFVKYVKDEIIALGFN